MKAPVRTVGSRLADDLRAAAEVLERDGWQGDVLHGPTGHDITGAVYVATGYHQYDETSRRWLAHPMERSAGRRADECIRWMLRHLPTRFVCDFDYHHCPDRAAAVEALGRAADAAERLLTNPRDVERLLS